MEFTTVFSNEVEKLLAANARLLEEPNYETINTKNIEARENFITQLSTLASLLAETTARLDAAISKSKSIHAKEMSMVHSLVNKLRKKGTGEWHSAARRPTHKSNIGPSRVLRQSAAKSSSARKDNLTEIKITEALHLRAVSVPGFNYVKQDGQLYYVEAADHFAIKIAGHLLHGNIGTIYTDEKSPEKIKDCRFAAACSKHDNCDYYHDPLKFAGSKDRRNFVASSWLYAPPDGSYKNRPKSRRFGSLDHLDIDIVSLHEDEISRFHDQTMHDLLCSILLEQTAK